MIELITTDELARRMGYAQANSAFREWCVAMRITPVPGRRGGYDTALVRRRLDEAQGLVPVSNDAEAPQSLVAARRARLVQGR
jgi:hypothetical protein